MVLHDARLGGWLAAMVEGNPERCEALSGFLAQDKLPLGLAALSAAVWRVLSCRDGDDADRALALNNLSNALADLGEMAAALAASRQAVEIRRRLAAAQPARYEPDLARSLNNLSSRLSEADEVEAALEAIREGIRLIEPYAAAFPLALPGQWLATMRRTLAELEQGPEAGA